VKSIDLPQKLRRKPKKAKCRQHKKILGRSIDERPTNVENRDEFGHWETDLVIGSKSGEDNVLLTLLERKTRYLKAIRIPDKSAESVIAAFQNICDCLGNHFSSIFKTLTTDNGSEFARLSELESGTDTKVYFAHPYTSCEKGSVENHNGLIRRFLRKGKRMDAYSPDDILGVELWANALPRKILGYKTPDEALEAELDSIYAA
jgi:IS30 family transposase